MSSINALAISTDLLNVNSAITIGNSSSNIVISTNSTALYLSSNISINNSVIAVGNSTINSTTLQSTAMVLNDTVYDTKYMSNTISSNNFTNYQVFTSNGTWTKPSWTKANDDITLMLWGGGGGSNNNYGGGGGACVIATIKAGVCNSVCNVVVGLGAIITGNVITSEAESSIFYPNTTYSITAYGGGTCRTTVGGGGGGWASKGSANTTNSTTLRTGGRPLGGSNTSYSLDSIFGGGAGANGTVKAGNSVFGGGGGGSSSDPGSSIYGGGGGATTANLGTSVFGGNGANNTTAATPPGGGGSSRTSGFANGARGEVRVWITRTSY